MLELDATLNWASAHESEKPALGGTSGTGYYNDFLAFTNKASTVAASASSFGTESFSIEGLLPDTAEVPFPRDTSGIFGPADPAGWSFTTPKTRQSSTYGFTSWDVSVAEDTKPGNYKFKVLWQFTPRGGSSAIPVVAETSVSIKIEKVHRKPVVPTQVVSGGVVNGGMELGSADWLTGGDATIGLNSAVAATGSGFARLGGAAATGTFSAARVAWLANSSLVVPSTKHATLAFSHKLTTDESGIVQLAYDQFSVLITDQAGVVHLQSALTNRDALSAADDYTNTKIDLNDYRGQKISITFLLSQDYTNPTTVLIDDIAVESTDFASRVGLITAGASSYSSAASIAAGAASGVLVAGAIIDSATVSAALLAAGVKTGLAALAASNPFSLLIGATIVSTVGTYLLYDSYPAPNDQIATAKSVLLSPAVTEICTAKNSRSDPMNTYIVSLTDTAESDLERVADGLAVKYNRLPHVTNPTQEPVTLDYYYSNSSGFAADMTPTTANLMQAEALIAGSKVVLVGEDSEVITHSETWPSPAGTAGSSAIDPPTPRPIKLPTIWEDDLWHLARISQRSSTPQLATYKPLNTGAGVTAYIIDTGLDVKTTNQAGKTIYNREFSKPGDTLGLSTRVTDAYQVPAPWALRNAFKPTPTRQQRIDTMTENPTSPHGSLVAALLGGNKFGVSAGVNIVPVSIETGAKRTSSVATMLAGLNWVIATVTRADNRANPFVVNLSVGISKAGMSATGEKQYNRAITALSARGLVTKAAGNDYSDACKSRDIGPISQTSAGSGYLVVGSTDDNDSAATTSNWGSCVSLFAPGENLPVPAHSGSTVSQRVSGTSFAAPLVAGAAAQLLANSIRVGYFLPAANLKSLIVSRATPGAVRNMRTGSAAADIIAGSPGQPNYDDEVTPPQNRLLYLGAECSRTDSAWWPTRPQWYRSWSPRSVDLASFDPACRSIGVREVRFTIAVTSANPLTRDPDFRAVLSLKRKGKESQTDAWTVLQIQIESKDLVWTKSGAGSSGVLSYAFELTPAEETDYWEFAPNLQAAKPDALTVTSWKVELL